MIVNLWVKTCILVSLYSYAHKMVWRIQMASEKHDTGRCPRGKNRVDRLKSEVMEHYQQIRYASKKLDIPLCCDAVKKLRPDRPSTSLLPSFHQPFTSLLPDTSVLDNAGNAQSLLNGCFCNYQVQGMYRSNVQSQQVL